MSAIIKFISARLDDEIRAGRDADDPGRVRAASDIRRELADHAGDGFLCVTLRKMAAPFAGHPDYRPEWRPEAHRGPAGY